MLPPVLDSHRWAFKRLGVSIARRISKWWFPIEFYAGHSRLKRGEWWAGRRLTARTHQTAFRLAIFCAMNSTNPRSPFFMWLNRLQNLPSTLAFLPLLTHA